MVCTTETTAEEEAKVLTEPEPKVLFIDIEWAPALAYVFQLRDQIISPTQLKDDGGLLCFSAIMGGESYFYSAWKDGRKKMATRARDLLSSADAVVTYNGDRYDIPKLFGEMLRHGLTPPSQPTSIDLYKTTKRMGFISAKLAYVGPMLGVGSKIENGGFQLWVDVLKGDKDAQGRMQEYCERDTALLIPLYERLKPYINNHPRITGPTGSCPTCGSDKLQKRGYRMTRYYRIQRVQCQGCGSWHETQRKKV